MSGLARRIASSLRQFVGNRRRAARQKVRLACTVSHADPRIYPNGTRQLPSLEGHTLDISAHGLALRVPAIRIGEHYLMGDNQELRVKLELPLGPVEMQVSPVRYENFAEGDSESGYMIGVIITKMRDADRARFDEYRRKLRKNGPAI